MRYFPFWWDTFFTQIFSFFWWDILLVYEMWVLQLFDITFTMVMEMVEGYFRKSPKIATKNASSFEVKLLKLLQFSVLNRLSCWWWWWCYRNLYLSMFPGEKDCTLALNFGGGAETEDNVPARFVYSTSVHPSFLFCQLAGCSSNPCCSNLIPTPWSWKDTFMQTPSQR